MCIYPESGKIFVTQTQINTDIDTESEVGDTSETNPQIRSEVKQIFETGSSNTNHSTTAPSTQEVINNDREIYERELEQTKRRTRPDHRSGTSRNRKSNVTEYSRSRSHDGKRH